MEGVREYLLSVTAGAILCGILGTLIGEKGSFSGLYRLISGIFLSFLVISPLARVNVRNLSGFTGEFLTEAERAALEGENSADKMLRQIITDETRAYIMDKAGSYGAVIQVEVLLSGDQPPVPESCTIRGSVSPYVRQQLKRMLVRDLGIQEENQTWIP